MSFSVSGLASGLDTSSLIDSIMQIEKQGQVNLQARKTAVQKTIDVYRALNTRVQAVETAARDLSTSTGWKAVTATTSDAAVATVSAAPPASAAALSFSVTALARAQASITPAINGDPATAGLVTGPVAITSGTTTTTISSLGDGSLNAVASAINASSAGVTATVVKVADGSYRLQLSARATGAASAFSVTGLEGLGALQTLVPATDAAITVGDPNGVHYDVTSANGTFTGLLSGVTITAKSLGTATVSVAPDSGAIADKVAKLVTSVNDALGYLSAQSSYDPSAKTGGALLGDQSASQVGQRLVNAVIDQIGSLGVTAGGVGISLSRDGTLSFDRDAFLAAWQADPAKVQAAFTANAADPTQDGIAERLRAAAHAATDVVSGTITQAVSSRTTQIKTLDDAIAKWDVTLAQRQDTLKKQFAAMEVALSSMKNQSSWLAGQINSLGTGR